MGPLEYDIVGQMLTGYLGLALLLIVFGAAFFLSNEKLWSDLYARQRMDALQNNDTKKV